MYLHPDTISALNNNKSKFNSDIQNSIHQIITMIKEFSPMSDINYIMYKTEKKLKGIKLPDDNGSWVPIRNIARIIAKIGDLEFGGIIDRIYIESMNCGCDYFQGDIKLNLQNDELIYGKYKWQWTAFPSNDRSFNKFTEFPMKESALITS